LEKLTGHLEKVIGYLEKAIGHSEKVTGHSEKVIGHLEKAIGHLEKVIGYLDKVIGYWVSGKGDWAIGKLFQWSRTCRKFLIRTVSQSERTTSQRLVAVGNRSDLLSQCAIGMIRYRRRFGLDRDAVIIVSDQTKGGFGRMSVILDRSQRCESARTAPFDGGSETKAMQKAKRAHCIEILVNFRRSK
jgi:hypothetical protein